MAEGDSEEKDLDAARKELDKAATGGADCAPYSQYLDKLKDLIQRSEGSDQSREQHQSRDHKGADVEKEGRGEGVTRRRGETAEEASAKSAASAVKSFDDVSVATAATGDKIAHPLSKKIKTMAYLDNWIRIPEGMVFVPAGEFVMGEGVSEHKVYLDDYRIGKYEVTNAEWKAFVDAKGARVPDHWKQGEIPEGKENHPVVYVSWEDAKAYCDWGSKETGRQVRLPTEAQWEKAASWDSGGQRKRMYPWGDQWDRALCNNGYLLAQFGFAPHDEGPDWDKTSDRWAKTGKGQALRSAGGNTMPVGSLPKGKSFYGCHDMAGNAGEWCEDWFVRDYFRLKEAKRNPQGPTEEQAEDKDFSGKKKGKARLVRGGSWDSHSGNCRTPDRNCYYPSYRDDTCGFRVVVAGKP
jgi:formylglycine-generating enzyme required for sulfatase activity